MKKYLPALLSALLLLFSLPATAQDARPAAPYRRWYIGSSLFLFGNLATHNTPNFAQLNVGYRLTPRDVVSVEAITWKYAWPLGIPYTSPSYAAKGTDYPGYIRDAGLALVYQRFWWRGAYTALHALNAVQRYHFADGRPAQRGYMLFLTYRAGYHVPLFHNRFFVEPSVAATHWPVRTNRPEAFAAKERPWPNHLFVEPGMHFGVKF